MPMDITTSHVSQKKPPCVQHDGFIELKRTGRSLDFRSVYLTVPGYPFSFSASSAACWSNVSGSMEQVAVLLATSTVTSVTPASSESAPRTLEAQPAHVTPATANETWLALTAPALVPLPGVLLDGDGWQPTASVRHASRANINRMIGFPCLERV